VGANFLLSWNLGLKAGSIVAAKGKEHWLISVLLRVRISETGSFETLAGAGGLII
jgi:hypothetical protein